MTIIMCVIKAILLLVIVQCSVGFPTIHLDTNVDIDNLNALGKVKVQIKNSKTGEFLYTSSAEDLAADQCRRRLFTWRDLKDIPGQPGSTWNQEDTWFLETTRPNNDASSSSYVVRLTSAVPSRSSEYLYIDASDGNVYLKRMCSSEESNNSALEESAQWLLSLADEEQNQHFLEGNDPDYDAPKGELYTLRNVRDGRYLSADSDDFFEHGFSTIRRNVFALDNQLSYWNIIVIPKNQEKRIPTTEAPPSTSITPSVTDGHSYYDEFLDQLCVLHQSVDVRFRNVKTKEFLYAAADDLAVNEQRRRLFTWKDLNDIPEKEGNAWTGEETWRIEPATDKDCFSSNSFGVRNIKPDRPPREYLFADSSDNFVYVKRDVPEEDDVPLNLEPSGKWQLLARVDDGLRGDICNVEASSVRGFVLRNEMRADGYLNADVDDIFVNDSTRMRRNVRLLHEGSTWEILLISD